MPAPWSLSGSPASFQPSGLVWSRHRQLCAGDVETPSLVEKLLSRDGIKVTGELGVSLSGKPLWQVKRCHGRDLVTGKQYSCVSASTTWTSGGLVSIDTTE